MGNWARSAIGILSYTALIVGIHQHGQLTHLLADDRALEKGTISDEPSTFLCKNNPYIDSFSPGVSLSSIETKAQTWILNREEHLKNTRNISNGKHDHSRFSAFQEFASCNSTCTGECESDTSKTICGIEHLKEGCIVYSIGGNDVWEFEEKMYDKTPCIIYTFDCTGNIERFHPPERIKSRLFFFHWCLSPKYAPAPLHPTTQIQGEMLPLHMIQARLNHSAIHLLKMDIEGYEWPLLYSWPEFPTVATTPNLPLPMQILVEVHYRTQMKDLQSGDNPDFKTDHDIVELHAHLLRMGYAIANRDDNPNCMHCTELTLVRFKCL